MTVLELEQALGMTRANIRFYEKEGLLSPARLENGYRDYSQGDLETLRKIKLLRQLRFDLEDIRAFQAGTKELTAALRDQEEKLRRQSDDLEAALTLCRRMEADGAVFGELDAQKYLSDMADMERSGVRFQSVESDRLPTVSHPWLRWLARGLDLALFSLPVDLLLFGVLRVLPSGSVLVRLGLSYLAWVLVFLLEPLLLSTWGTTPGKWVLGLTLRTADGEKLTWNQAMERLWLLFGKGEGWGLPFYNLYRNYRSFRACADGEVLPWDEGLSYTLREDRRVLRVLGCLAVRGAAFLLTLVLGLRVLLPPVRGELTVAQFARNYNEMVRVYDLGDRYLLDETGAWVDHTPPNTIFLGSDGPPCPIRYQLDGDRITAVSLEYRKAPVFLDLDGTARGSSQAMILALLGSRPGVHPFGWAALIRDLPAEAGSAVSSSTVQYGGLTIDSQVEYQGYELWVDQLLLPLEGQAQSYRQVLTITLDG